MSDSQFDETRDIIRTATEVAFEALAIARQDQEITTDDVRRARILADVVQPLAIASLASLELARADQNEREDRYERALQGIYEVTQAAGPALPRSPGAQIVGFLEASGAI